MHDGTTKGRKCSLQQTDKILLSRYFSTQETASPSTHVLTAAQHHNTYRHTTYIIRRKHTISSHIRPTYVYKHTNYTDYFTEIIKQFRAAYIIDKQSQQLWVLIFHSSPKNKGLFIKSCKSPTHSN